MKKLFLLISVFSFVMAFGQKDIIPPKPNPPRLVNDLADKLLPESEALLERKLVAYDDSTSNQIVIVIVDNLHGYEPVEYATELGETWGVGGAKFDNGIVILVSLGENTDTEKRSLFIATGRGLEGAITDATAGHIRDEYLVPNLRAGNFYRAFDEATTALMKAAAGEYKAPPGYRDRGQGKGFSPGKLVIAIIILVVMLSMFGGGGRNGGYMSRRGYRGFGGGPIIFPGGFGGGGGGFGGGSGGGGFGGFGGGSFGGGGAGGSW